MGYRLAFRLQLGAFVITLQALTASFAFAFDAPDWERLTPRPGTVRFECRAPACGGAAASYSKAPGDVIENAEGFKRVIQGTRLVASGAVSELSRVAKQEEKIGGYKHYQEVDRVVYRNTGRSEFSVVGILVGKSGSYILTSFSADRALAEKNYRKVLGIARALLDRPGFSS